MLCHLFLSEGVRPISFCKAVLWACRASLKETEEEEIQYQTKHQENHKKGRYKYDKAS